MSGMWTEQDQKYWEDKENQFIYNFNLLFTSGDYWDRNPKNVKPREEALRKLYQQAIQMQAVVKPACEMERPKLENFLPEDTTTAMINNMFLENIELYNYINALDQYIDELERKSV